MADLLELTENLRMGFRDMRIQIAQQRDELLTEAETVAMLDVYQEFGR